MASDLGERDYAAIALGYCHDVLDGTIVAGKWARLACERHLRDLARAESDPKWPYYFDPWWAADACGFIEKLPHVEGEWKTETIFLEPWQVFATAGLFGWRRASDEGRRFNTAYLEVGRKNAKSTWSAGVALYCLTCEGENGPQIKLAATTGAQTDAVFQPAKAMVERTSDLREAFGLEAMARSIPCHMNGGHIKPINAKASTQDGLNPHVAILDELHAHKTRALFDVLKSARGARKNPLSLYITTAGYNLAGVCFEQRTIVTKILLGIFPGDHYFGLIFTLDVAETEDEEDDDPYDESNWPKANPNLGVSVDLQELREYAAEAQISPDSEGEFKTKRLNMWLGAAGAWLNMQQWDNCKKADLTLEQFEGEAAWAAVDLAAKNDVAAAAIVFERSGELYGFGRYWLPKELVQERAKTHAHYLTWAQQGLLKLTPGNMIDYAFIEAELEAWCERFDMRSLGFDPYQSNQIATSMLDKGHEVVVIPNTVKSMSDPAKDFEARVQVGRFHHNGDPVMKWMASNVVVYRDQKANIFPKKEKPSSPQKIDVIVAMIMAIGRWLLEEDTTSVYDREGRGVAAW